MGHPCPPQASRGPAPTPPCLGDTPCGTTLLAGGGGACRTLLLNSRFDFVTCKKKKHRDLWEQVRVPGLPILRDSPFLCLPVFQEGQAAPSSLEIICSGGCCGWREHYERRVCVCARAGAHACACVRECARTPVQKVQLLCPPACERVSLRPCLTYSAAPRPPRAIAGVDHECLKSGLFPKSCVPLLWLAGEMGVGASRPSPASADDYCTWTASSFLEVYLYCHFITLWPLS